MVKILINTNPSVSAGKTAPFNAGGFFLCKDISKMGKKIIWTKEQLETIFKMYNEGKPTREVADFFNVSARTVLRITKALRDKKRQEVTKLRKQGKKLCKGCKILKNVNCFNKHALSADRLSYKCKSCLNVPEEDLLITFWTDELAFLEAKKYETPTYMSKGSPGAYDYLRKHGLRAMAFGHTTGYRKITEDLCNSVVDQYYYLKDLKREDVSVYAKCKSHYPHLLEGLEKSVGGFTRSQFIQNCKSEGGLGLFYIIKCQILGGEVFFKLGITSVSLNERYRTKSNMAYDYEIVTSFLMDSGDCWDLERQLKSDIADGYSYQPSIWRGKSTETFLDITLVNDVLGI